MLIDCDTCTVRGLACGDCVVTVILNNPPQPVELDDAEQAAVNTLAAAGLCHPCGWCRNVIQRAGDRLRRPHKGNAEVDLALHPAEGVVTFPRPSGRLRPPHGQSPGGHRRIART